MFSRALVAPAALALIQLTAQVQMSVVAGQSLFAATAAASSGSVAAGSEAGLDARQRMAREAFIKSILRVYTKAYEDLRQHEHIVRNGLSMLVAKAQDIARRTLDNMPVTRTFSFEAAGTLFQVMRREMDESVLCNVSAIVCPSDDAAQAAAADAEPEVESLGNGLDAEASVSEFLERLSDGDVTAEDIVGADDNGEPQTADAVCDLLYLFTRSASQEKCFEEAYKHYSSTLWDILLTEMGPLFQQQASATDSGEEVSLVHLPLPMLAMRVTPVLEAFCGKQTSLESVVALNKSSKDFKRYLFSVFLQQQPN